jgi:hypothetical protein
LWPLSAGGALGHSQRGQLLRVINLIADGRQEEIKFGGNESASYVVSNDAISDVLSLIQIRFGLVLERCILRHVQCFVVNHLIRHKDCTLTSVFSKAVFMKKALRAEDDGRI